MKKSYKSLDVVRKLQFTKIKSNQGITLISLVITIIILLILSAITISQLTGNGLFGRTKEAKEQAIKKQAEEEISLIVMDVQAEKQGKGTLEDIVQKLKDDEENEYLVKTERKVASLNGEGITDIANLNGNEKAIYVTNLKYGVEIKVFNTLEVSTVEEISKEKDNNEIGTLKITKINGSIMSGEDGSIAFDVKPFVENYDSLSVDNFRT